MKYFFDKLGNDPINFEYESYLNNFTHFFESFKDHHEIN